MPASWFAGQTSVSPRPATHSTLGQPMSRSAIAGQSGLFCFAITMFVGHILEDARLALRQVRRAPLWAAAIVLTLALGIGANIAIFNVLDALVLRKLPVRDPDRLVKVAAIYRNGSNFPLSFALLQQITENQRVFSDLFGWSGDASYNVQLGSSIFVGGVRSVTGNYYSALGAAPLIGRLIAPEDAGNVPGTVAVFAAVSPEFFRTLGISLMAGRDFDWGDDPHHPLVAIVDSNLARRLRPTGDAVGMHVRFGVQPEFQQLEIVGVARSARIVSLRFSDDLVIYVPISQHPLYADYGSLFARSQNPAGVKRELENKIQSLGHEYPRSAKTLEETGDETLVEDRAIAVLSSIFGGLALLLAAIGLFGLMSYAVTRRTREIGIRMALGSKAGAVLRLVMRESLQLSAVGVILGVPCALAATHLFGHFLFGVTPTDPMTLIFTFSVLLIVGVIAGYWPARRAATTDPMIALRHE